MPILSALAYKRAVRASGTSVFFEETRTSGTGIVSHMLKDKLSSAMLKVRVRIVHRLATRKQPRTLSMLRMNRLRHGASAGGCLRGAQRPHRTPCPAPQHTHTRPPSAWHGTAHFFAPPRPRPEPRPPPPLPAPPPLPRPLPLPRPPPLPAPPPLAFDPAASDLSCRDTPWQ